MKIEKAKNLSTENMSERDVDNLIDMIYESKLSDDRLEKLYQLLGDIDDIKGVSDYYMGMKHTLEIVIENYSYGLEELIIEAQDEKDTL